jgi:hypothetical protein
MSRNEEHSSISKKAIYPFSIRLTLIAALILNNIDIEATQAGEDIEIGLNAMAVVKACLVAAAGILGFVGFWTSRRTRELWFTPAGALAVAMVFIYLATMPTSIHRLVSTVATISITAYLLLITACLAFLGPERILRDILYATGIYLAIAWICYFAFPSVGVLREYAGAQEAVGRMTGLAHPNTLGGIASLFFILLACRFDEGLRGRRLLGIIFGGLTILASLSRTAIVACTLSMLGIHRRWFRHRLVVYSAFPLMCFAFAAICYVDNEYDLNRVVKQFLVGISKTKDSEEITSATGRTEIWAYVVKLVKRSPFYGYGANTSPILLKDHSFQTHNIILNPTLCHGILGGILITSWLIVNLYWVFNSDNPEVRAIGIYILVSGLTEDTILSTFPETMTLAWLSATFIPYCKEEDSEKEIQYDALSQSAPVSQPGIVG